MTVCKKLVSFRQNYLINLDIDAQLFREEYWRYRRVAGWHCRPPYDPVVMPPKVADLLWCGSLE